MLGGRVLPAPDAPAFSQAGAKGLEDRMRRANLVALLRSRPDADIEEIRAALDSRASDLAVSSWRAWALDRLQREGIS